MSVTMKEPMKFAEIEGFIDMLRAACEDEGMRKTLARILSLPTDQRRQLIHNILDDMRAKRAPTALLDAFVCMLDDEAARKAHAVIFSDGVRILQ
jgi:hypothetical protein